MQCKNNEHNVYTLTKVIDVSVFKLNEVDNVYALLIIIIQIDSAYFPCKLSEWIGSRQNVFSGVFVICSFV